MEDRSSLSACGGLLSASVHMEDRFQPTCMWKIALSLRACGRSHTASVHVEDRFQHPCFWRISFQASVPVELQLSSFRACGRSAFQPPGLWKINFQGTSVHNSPHSWWMSTRHLLVVEGPLQTCKLASVHNELHRHGGWKADVPHTQRHGTFHWHRRWKADHPHSGCVEVHSSLRGCGRSVFQLLCVHVECVVWTLTNLWALDQELGGDVGTLNNYICARCNTVKQWRNNVVWNWIKCWCLSSINNF